MDPGYEVGIYILVSITVVEIALLVNWSLTVHRLWKYYSINSIVIRRPSAVLFSCFLSIAAMIRAVIQLLLGSFAPTIFHAIYLPQSILMALTAFALFYSVVYRTWLIYYDIKFNQAIEAEQWQCHIDSKTLKSSWYIKNRQKYRNAKTVIIIVSIPLLFFAVLGAVSIIIKGRNAIAQLTFALNMLTPVILLIILICKMPKYDDHYKLRKETILISISTIVGVFIAFPMLVGLGASPGSWKWIITQGVQIELVFTISAISTHWVLKQFGFPAIYCRVQKSEDFLELSMTGRSLSSVTDVKTGGTQTDIHVDVTTGNIEFVDVLKDAELFNVFASHLSKEFCIENVLYFVETHQLQQYMRNHYGVELKNVGIDSYELSAENIPSSTIVQDLKDGGDLNDAAINIFLKYIDYQDAYFCVNLSSNTRQGLYDVFGYLEVNVKDNKALKQEAMTHYMKQKNVTPQQIYDVFYETRREIYELLLSSFIRFKKIK